MVHRSTKIDLKRGLVFHMTKVNIKEKFNTSFGLILLVDNDRTFHIGDKINTDEGQYKIEQIKFSTKPTEDNIVSLVVS